MPRPSALSLSLCLLAACAAPSGGGDPLEGVPAEDYRPEAARAELQVGQLLVQCDTKLTAWQMAMGAERDLENLEQIDFTERAIATLVRQNKEELKRLTVAGEPRSRAIATAALAFAREDPSVLELIMSNVGHEDPMLAANAMLAVGIHAAPATPMAPIHEVVTDPAAPDPVMRNAAYACLRLARIQVQVGDPDPYLAATMIPMLQHELISVRTQATAGLGVIRAAHAVGFLTKRLSEDTEARVRTFAAWSLGEIGDRSATPVLARALGDADGYVAGAARAALQKIHGEDRGPSAEDWIADPEG